MSAEAEKARALADILDEAGTKVSMMDLGPIVYGQRGIAARALREMADRMERAEPSADEVRLTSDEAMSLRLLVMRASRGMPEESAHLARANVAIQRLCPHDVFAACAERPEFKCAVCNLPEAEARAAMREAPAQGDSVVTPAVLNSIVNPTPTISPAQADAPTSVPAGPEWIACPDCTAVHGALCEVALAASAKNLNDDIRANQEHYSRTGEFPPPPPSAPQRGEQTAALIDVMREGEIMQFRSKPRSQPSRPTTHGSMTYGRNPSGRTSNSPTRSRPSKPSGTRRWRRLRGFGFGVRARR
jgi:hypothetical protein